MNLVRMLPVHNEADILQRNLDWYARAGFPTVAVDNESTDDSHDICRAALREGTIAAFERIETGGSDRPRIAAALFTLAMEQQADYVVRTDADEFFEVADGSDLRSAMEEDFRAGYTLLSFSNMEFLITDQDDPSERDPVSRMRHYVHRPARMYRAFPCLQGIMPRGAHKPVFPPEVEERVSPRTYISRHYPLRTSEQAFYKIKRIAHDSNQPSAGSRYRHLNAAEDLVADAWALARYGDDHRWDFQERVPLKKARQMAKTLKRTHAELMELRREHESLERRHAQLLDEHARLREELSRAHRA